MFGEAARSALSLTGFCSATIDERSRASGKLELSGFVGTLFFESLSKMKFKAEAGST